VYGLAAQRHPVLSQSRNVHYHHTYHALALKNLSSTHTITSPPRTRNLGLPFRPQTQLRPSATTTPTVYHPTDR
jgi:hypothetical protein